MKAVSPLVATGVLLVVTLVGGVLIYNFVFRSLSSAKEYALVTIASAKAVNTGDRVVISMKVSNIGTARAYIHEFEVIPLNLTRKLDVTIEPGVTKSFNVVLNGGILNDRCFVILRYNGGETEPHPIVAD